MDTIFEEIERALEAGLIYSAVTIALSIPDICAALQHPVGHAKGSNKSGYIRWYQRNLAAQYPNLTGNDFYSLRCGVVHTGRFGTENGLRYARLIFTGEDRRNSIHNNEINDMLQLDAATFCADMIAAARSWLTANATDRNVQRNLSRVVLLYPTGMPGCIADVPTIG